MGMLGGFKALFQGSGKVDIKNRFELLREAICGTMSDFYMARDRTTGQIVGVKVLDAHKTEQFEGRFKGLQKPIEGAIAKSLIHPNIVKTLEYGTTTKGQQYIVMEFLDGPGLNSLIVSHNPALDGKRVVFIRQAAKALAAVHQAGYIHRDVCPRNFVLNRDFSTLKLIDFGLTVPATAPFMQPGNRTGTANYMAPELVRRRNTSHRVDIFAFGVTAYELCARELPWPRGTGKEAMSHASQEPTDIHTFCPMINPRLAKAIATCLEVNPEKRPESMEAFLAMFRGVEREDDM